MNIIPSWVADTTTALSIGKRSTHAQIKSQHDTTLAMWLEAQTAKKREGALTAVEYERADKPQRAADKAQAGGAWYSFANYANGHRSGPNWQGSNIVVLDADAKHGQEEDAKYSFTAAQLAHRLSGLQFIALPTHSYTDNCPRWRIVIPLTERVTNRGDFAEVAKHLGGKLDAYVDPRSETPEQYWFSLSAPKGEWETRLGLIVVGN